MARRIEIEPVRTLAEHAQFAHLSPAVESLRQEAAPLARALQGRTVWMVNSTSQGGGVSEMLPGIVSHLRELGIRTEWTVIDSDDDAFFQLTKRIHNMIHGDGAPGLNDDDRQLLERVNRENAAELVQDIRRDDILLVHDPQPAPLAGMIRKTTPVTAIWRCHIGLDTENDATADVWRFLQPYGADYDHAVFSAPEYTPSWFEGRSTIIHPALDPLTAKNQPLSALAVAGVLERAGLLPASGLLPEPLFDTPVRRLQSDGTWQRATRPDPIGLLARPIITQVSRWDRLKGFLPLMRGFARFREGLHSDPLRDDVVGRRMALSRLVLAGPDPDSIADDPEGREVLQELREAWLACDPAVRPEIALLALPMRDPVVNALIVNALQRVSSIIVQNSLREGFGLTITEAMWKGVPVLSNSMACGPRQQVRDRIDGRLIADPGNDESIAAALHDMLSGECLGEWGHNAQQRVHEQFLIYAQLRQWVRLLGSLTGAVKAS